MILKDKFGSKINFYQARNGKICISLGNDYFTLSKEDTQKITVYDIEDFDIDDYKNAYK